MESNERLENLNIVEALLFASPDPLSAERISSVLGIDAKEARTLLEDLEKRLEAENRPYELKRTGNTYRLFTRPRFHAYISRLKGIRQKEGLSQAALETLAIIAYRQPIIRVEIEDIRGVKCGPMLRALLERKLIRVVGRADVPGRPLLYGTTRQFLDHFGLSSLKDLPSLRELKEGKPV